MIDNVIFFNIVMRKIVYLIFCVECMLLLSGCHADKNQEIWNVFPSSQSLVRRTVAGFDKDSIAVIEGLDCDGENLVVMDLHAGMCYTLFDVATGRYVGRFGALGQGPGEIDGMCVGYLSGRCFTAFSPQTRRIWRYSMDSLRAGRANASPLLLATYEVPELEASALAVCSDSLFMAAGTYRSAQQYCLFTRENSVLDSAVDIYNKDDDAFNAYTRPLANQGIGVVRPGAGHYLAYALLFSANMDILSVNGNRISLVKSLHYGDPDFESQAIDMGGGMTGYSATPARRSAVGYLDLCASRQGIYALYSDVPFEESRRSSRDVLYFDWAGNPVAHYTLEADAFHIAVDPEGRSLYTAERSEAGEHLIGCYNLNK